MYPRNQPQPRQRRPKGRATDCSRPATPVREGRSPLSRSCNPNSFITKAGVRGHRKTRQRTLRGGETRVGYPLSSPGGQLGVTADGDVRSKWGAGRQPRGKKMCRLSFENSRDNWVFEAHFSQSRVFTVWPESCLQPAAPSAERHPCSMLLSLQLPVFHLVIT